MKTEIRTPLVPYRVELQCTVANGCHGRMVFTGETMTTSTTSYKHRCSTCKGVAWLDHTYPHIEHDVDPVRQEQMNK
jgi:hypothetical protein